MADVDRTPFGSGRCGTSPGPTVGVEEEFTLLDPRTGAVVPRAAEVIRDCQDAGGVASESMSYMVETRTPVCGSLAEVRDALRTRRRRIVEVAQRYGAVAVPSGLPPFGLPRTPAVTDASRYLELARQFPFAMSENGTCSCHVHVAVPTRQLGVAALLRLRRWLPALIALTANSPIWEGRDTGWASRRWVHTSRWPTVVPPPPARSVEEYDALVRAAVASGDALDDRSVYFLARLSPRYPTIELRVADVGLTADETVGYAGLVRALVARSVAEAEAGRPVAFVDQAALHESCATAAQVGLGGRFTDPETRARVGAWELVDELATWVRPQLAAHGDEDVVVSTLDLLRVVGGGAERQRRLFRDSPAPAAFVGALTAAATSDLGAAYLPTPGR